MGSSGSAAGLHVQFGTYVNITKFLAGKIFFHLNDVKKPLANPTPDESMRLDFGGIGKSRAAQFFLGMSLLKILTLGWSKNRKDNSERSSLMIIPKNAGRVSKVLTSRKPSLSP